MEALVVLQAAVVIAVALPKGNVKLECPLRLVVGVGLEGGRMPAG
jgi:hypothetical protein